MPREQGEGAATAGDKNPGHRLGYRRAARDHDKGGEAGNEPADDSPAEQAEQRRGAEEQQEAAPEPEPAPAAAIGETVEVGSVAWQVTSATPTTQLTSDFMEPKQGAFVVVDFLFTNNGDESVTLDPVSLALLDGRGRTFDPDTDTFGCIPRARTCS